MKTFEEALGLFMQFHQVNPGEDVATVNARVSADMDDGLGRTAPLIEEICKSEVAGHFVVAFMREFGENRQPLMVMMVHLFAHGVAVGVEMEKQTEMKFN